MELYKAKSNTVEFEAPNADVTVSASWTLNGVPQTSIVAVRSTTEPTIWTMTIPYMPEEGKADITWTFGANSVVESYEVVTPYLTHRYVSRNILPGATPAAVAEAEAAARYIVNAHCGQQFGKRRETKRIRGTGESALRLPSKIIKLYSITAEGLTTPLYDVNQHYGDPLQFIGKDVFGIDGDGWWITRNQYYGDGIKSDMTYTVTGPIFNPLNGYGGSWRKGRTLLIDADWGWESVPMAVQEAMKLLVRDYSCNEAQYRDNYLQSMMSADWRIQFHAGAYAKTGNARADQLLAPYVNFGGWAVV